MKCILPPAFIALLAGCGPEIGPVVPATTTERKMIGLLQKFDLWDLDGSGDLDLTELTKGIREGGTDHPPENVMAFYDTNGDGRISLAEAQEGYQRAGEADARIRERRASES